MNTRALLHTLAAVATAIAAGTAVIAGVDDSVNKIIVSVAGIVSLAINTYMSQTTTGVSK
jgi:hypothetical protein